MNGESPGYNPEQDPQTIAVERKRQLMETRDKYRDGASELQKSVAEGQSTKLETTLYRLMSRSKDNPKLINALNRFVDALGKRSMFGSEDEAFGPKTTENLTKFIEEQSKKLEDVEVRL